MRGRSLREAVLAAVPILRAVAVAVCGRVEQVDDLVQEGFGREFLGAQGCAATRLHQLPPSHCQF